MGRITICSSQDEMIDLGMSFAKSLRPNQVIALSGDLGAGKTTFVQGVARGLGIDVPIQSPTFVFLNQYQGALPLFHFDLYRLNTEEDFLGLGFDECFMSHGITMIEWPERIASLIEEKADWIVFSHHARGREVLFKERKR